MSSCCPRRRVFWDRQHQHQGFRLDAKLQRRSHAVDLAVGPAGPHLGTFFYVVVGLGVMKVTPMYIKNMRMDSILTDIAREMSGQGSTPQSIRNALAPLGYAVPRQPDGPLPMAA